MLRRNGPELRSLATFGIAIFGPLALISFLLVLVTSVGGVLGIVGAAAVITIPLAVFAITLYLAVDLTGRYATAPTTDRRDGAPADDGGSD